MIAARRTIPLGRLVMTAGVAELMSESPAMAEALPIWLGWHAANDCPNLSEDDRAANELAIRDGDRVLTSWVLPLRSGDVKLWIITEWDRSQTTVLLPSEY